jgi:excinuclease ABC subunit A
LLGTDSANATETTRGAHDGKTIVEICQLPLTQAAAFFTQLQLDDRQRQIAGELIKEIHTRLTFLIDVGLEYLALDRAAPTLSGGEAQRIRLASQIGSGLSGVLYVLDEPTIGLHPRDTRRLVHALAKLRNLGNTLLLVEHDRDVIRSADRILDFGPRAGSLGGELVAEGTPADFVATDAVPPLRGDHKGVVDAKPSPDPLPMREGDNGGAVAAEPRSLTRAYLTGITAIPIPANRRPVGDPAAVLRPADEPELILDDDDLPATGARRTRPPGSGLRKAGGVRRGREREAPSVEAPTDAWLVVRGARQNNLKNIDVPIPLGRFVCVTGVSGSGKSSLVKDILWSVLAREINRANLPVGDHDRIEGVERLAQVINVDQAPLGVTPSSNPATYTGAFDLIRNLFAKLPDAKLRGYTANRFSFNRPGGRCEACEGYGQRCIEMHFMPDVWVECETCAGKRYNPETLAIRFKGKNIADVLELRVAAALELFANVPKVRRVLQTLADVGLDYVQLGQPAPTLSGGEAQRVKLAAELCKPDTGRTFYILDEPTTGLHFDDVRKLLTVIHRLVDLGNTVLVVEHNLDVIKAADWVIDLGPEAGAAGGFIVVAGTPEGVTSSEYRVASSEGTAPAIAPDSQSDSQVATRYSPLSTPSHTAAALAPILAAGPYEERPLYDRVAHAAQELAIEKAGLGHIGREVRMPWQVDGRKWHLEQRTSRADKPVRWEAAALEFVVGLVQAEGRRQRAARAARGASDAESAFAPTNWNDRASVEITAPGADKWFMHALTGGEWLLELYFRVPPGKFSAAVLERQIGLKTLDQREDLETYGDWARVDVRERCDGIDVAVVYVHDRAEIDTAGFRKFVKDAVNAYLKGVLSGR